MTERTELQLRDLLLELGAQPTRQEIDASVELLLTTRFSVEEAIIPEAVRERHLDAIRSHLERRTSWILLPTIRRKLAWGALALVCILSLFLFLWTKVFPSLDQSTYVKEQPAPKRQETPLRVPEKPKQEERIVEKTPPKKSESPEVRIKSHPVPHRPRQNGPTNGLLASRVKVGEFSSVMGMPKVTHLGESTSLNALPKMSVTTAMRIETGDADKATIRFADGSTISLGFNTTVTVPEVQGRQGARPIFASVVSVTAGSIEAHITHSDKRGLFAVHTPVATAEVLGTEFSLALNHLPEKGGKAKLKAVLQVQEGRVAFYNDLGREVVGASMESMATDGSAPTEPKRMAILKTYRARAGMAFVVSATSQLVGPEAADRFVFPLGSAGLSAKTSSQGKVRIVKAAIGLPASKAGVKVGDVVVALNGSPVQSPAAIHQSIARRPGQRVELTIDRNGETLTFAFETVRLHPIKTRLSQRLAERLYAATWPAIVGDSETSLQLLRALAKGMENAAVYNNLGVVLETFDQMGPAIRAYLAAIRLDPMCARFHYNLSFALEKIGNFNRSVEEARKVTEIDPQFRPGLLQLSDALFLLDRYEEALAALNTPPISVDRYPSYWIQKAKVLHASGRLDAAQVAAKKATEVDPDDYAAFSSLGYILADQGRLKEAEAAYQRVLTLDPDSAPTYVQLGVLLSNSDRGDHAEALLRHAIALDPGMPYAYNALGNRLVQTHRFGEAEAMFRKTISLVPGFAIAHNNLGNLLKMTGRFPEAEVEYRKAITHDPGYASPYGALGSLLQNEGRLREAETLYHRALVIEPRFGEVYANLGVILQVSRRFKEAEETFRKAIPLVPTPELVYEDLGDLYVETGRFQNAEAMYRKAIEMAPKLQGAIVNLVQLLEQLGRLQDGEEVFRNWVKADPQNPNALNSLAWFLADHSMKLDDALEYASRALALTPKDPNTMDTLGWTYYRRQEFEKAEQALKRALEIYTPAPEVADCWIHLGMTYEGMNKREQAIDAYRQALKLQPGHKEAVRALKRLGG